MSYSDFAIQIEGFRKRYDKLLAVNNLDLRIHKGTFFGFVGPNGAGKSTTINAMVGLLRPSGGSIKIAGFDIEKQPLEVKARVGFMPEEVMLYERLTASEFLEFVGRMYGLNDLLIARRISELLDMLDLEPDKLMGTFSMGMKKKAALAAALIHQPPVIILDEPFSGIDASTGSKIRSTLNQLVRNGHTVFFSSHVLETVEKISTEIGVIHKGKLLSCGTLDQIRSHAGLDQSASLEDAFLKLIDSAAEMQVNKN